MAHSTTSPDIEYQIREHCRLYNARWNATRVLALVVSGFQALYCQPYEINFGTENAT